LLLQFLQSFGSNIVNGGSDRSCGRAAPAAAGGRKLSIADTDRNLFRLKAENVCRDHRNDSFRAGAKVLCAVTDCDAAVRIDLGLSLGAAATAAPGSAGAAHSGFDRAGRTSGLLVFLLPTEPLSSELVFLAPHFRSIVFDAQLDRIDSHFF